MSYVVSFEQLRMTDVDSVGGKNASLGEMISQLAGAGVRVPGGFATTADAFREFLQATGLDARINQRLDALDADDVRELANVGAEIRQWIVDTPFMERAGMAGGPKPIRVSPEVVARKIFDAIAIRAREVNAVPWQTAAVALGEHFPRITDLVIERSSRLVGIQPSAPTPLAATPEAQPSPIPVPA